LAAGGWSDGTRCVQETGVAGHMRLGIIAVVLLALARSAHAATIDFTFTETDGLGSVTAEGTLTAEPLGGDAWLATAGTATVSGAYVSGLFTLTPNPDAPGAAYSPSGMFIYDNQAFPGQAPELDVDGLLFAQGGTELNLWGNGSDTPYSFYEWPGPNGYFAVTGTFADGLDPSVPEPMSAALFAAGVAGLAAARLRRRS